MERSDKGLDVLAIITEWNKGGLELWNKIDPDDPTPYLVDKSEERKVSVKKVRSQIDRCKKKRNAKQQGD